MDGELVNNNQNKKEKKQSRIVNNSRKCCIINIKYILLMKEAKYKRRKIQIYKNMKEKMEEEK